MKAITLSANGGPEVLGLQDVPKPEIKPDQILVKVQAVAVNPIDCKIRKTGAFGYGAGSILGFDVSGTVEQAGALVHNVHVGDAVFYSPDFSLPGANAQYHAVRADIVAKKPTHLGYVEAASVPLTALTAWASLMEQGDLRLGQTVLIIGASGGVGSMAVQLAHAAGAYVFAVCSAANVGLVRSLGADRVIDRQSEDFAAVIQKEAGTVDLVFDCFGDTYASRSIPIVKPMGRIVTIVDPKGDLSLGYRHNIAIHYVSLAFDSIRRRVDDMKIIAKLLDREILKPVVHKVMPLENLADAHRALESGGGFGKIVLTVSH
ncbi:MAG: quinone oxidoreductase family protein [Phycisphaerae bacterium]